MVSKFAFEKKVMSYNLGFLVTYVKVLAKQRVRVGVVPIRPGMGVARGGEVLAPFSTFEKLLDI